jgi:hypothetical protein
VVLVVVAIIGLANLFMLSQFKKAVLVGLSHCDLRTLANTTMSTASNVIVGGNMI